jgi:hypothetical protein
LGSFEWDWKYYPASAFATGNRSTKKQAIILSYYHSRPRGIIVQSPSKESLDKFIMTSVRRQRSDSIDEYDMTQLLSPSQMKKLKLYADEVAERTGCPQEVLHDFIDVSISEL